MSFSADELSRYQRHLSLAGFGPEAQTALKRGSVLVIGAGGLGCPALLYLAAAGVGRITIIDADTVDVSNLQRQVLYTTADTGLPKATAAARRLLALNPLLAITPVVARLTRTNALALVSAHDVVLDGSDNFSTRYLVNDACVLANRPLIYGAIQGFEGQASVFNLRGGPTYRCLFPEPPAPGTVPNCAEAGVLGVLPGLIGTIQATEAIKVLTGLGEPLSGRLLLWNSLTMTSRTLRFAADPASRAITELPPDGYGETCAVPSAAPASNPDELSADELRARLASVQLIDVREDWERALGAIQPSTHVPLGSLDTDSARAALASLDPQRPTVVYCAGGVRSLKALPVLRARHGFTSALSLHGGYKAWSAQSPAQEGGEKTSPR
ncbi:MAG: molybdopterin-synthase adenylyltransferase MoeB [Opitutaceae bacterium]|jgi:adenylyltransferase/sulfurtransferase